MATVKLTAKLIDAIQDKARVPANNAIGDIMKNVIAGLRDKTLEALYDQLMPAEHREALESLPSTYLNLDPVPQLYIRFGEKNEQLAFNFRDSSVRFPVCLQHPVKVQKFFNTYAAGNTKDNNLANFKETFPGAYEVLGISFEQLDRLIRDRDVLVKEIEEACKANVTLNRLLKAVPAFERYVPDQALEAVRKSKGMVSSKDNNWTPGQLKGAMLVTDVTVGN